MERRAAAKLMRLEISQELRRMLESIPARLRENVRTNHVYFGEGVAHGMENLEVEVRVFLFEGKRMASVRVLEYVLVAPFGAPEEQAKFAKEATRTILSKMN